jgi:hypothetical protein
VEFRTYEKANTMVETQFSVLDSQEDTPLVRADHLGQQNDALLTPGTPSAKAVPLNTSAAAPTGASQNTCEGSDIPTISTEEDEMNSNRIVGAGVASGIVGFLVGGPILAMLFGFTAACKYS